MGKNGNVTAGERRGVMVLLGLIIIVTIIFGVAGPRGCGADKEPDYGGRSEMADSASCVREDSVKNDAARSVVSKGRGRQKGKPGKKKAEEPRRSPLDEHVD